MLSLAKLFGKKEPVYDRMTSLLIKAGWHEGRCWSQPLMQSYLERFDSVFPAAAISVLSEFGGLDIGSGGRTVTFGDYNDQLRDSHGLFPTLVGETLFPVGHTNIFEDDGLGVLMDGSGKVYVDGATAYDPPRDYRVDLISPNIESFLSRLFSQERASELRSWYYSASDLR